MSTLQYLMQQNKFTFTENKNLFLSVNHRTHQWNVFSGMLYTAVLSTSLDTRNAFPTSKGME